MALNKDIYYERKIIDSESDLENVIDKYLKLIANIEKHYGRNRSSITELINSLRHYILKGAIIVTTPMLLAVQGKCGFSSCGIVPVDLRSDYESIKASLFSYLVMGRGLGFALDEVDNPKEALYKLNKIFIEVEKHCSRLAGMATLRIEHPGAKEFISSKRNISFEDFRFNISVMLSKEYVEKAIEARKRAVYNVEREMIVDIAENMYYRGEPGVIFISKFDSDNPTPNLKYVSVSPCAEIAMAEGEQCVFGYLNLNEFINGNEIDYEDLESAVAVLTRMLDDTIDIIENYMGDRDSVLSMKRRIGIGFCGLADVFAHYTMEYGSDESIELTAQITSNINLFSKRESINIASERGRFKLFDESRYKDYSWFMRFSDNARANECKTKWEQLWDEMKKHGIRNASTMATPPTANSSRLVDSSYSIEPFFKLNDRKRIEYLIEKVLLQRNIAPKPVLEYVKVHGNMKGLNIDEKIKNIFKIHDEIDYKKQIDIVSEAQKYTDDSISKTITLPYNSSLEQIEDIIYYSYEKNLKGITVFINTNP